VQQRKSLTEKRCEEWQKRKAVGENRSNWIAIMKVERRFFI
jgi:hypothetical protein